jgi:hypothetical protein
MLYISADCQQTLSRLSPDSQQTLSRLSADCQQTLSRLSADSQQTVILPAAVAVQLISFITRFEERYFCHHFYFHETAFVLLRGSENCVDGKVSGSEQLYCVMDSHMYILTYIPPQSVTVYSPHPITSHHNHNIQPSSHNIPPHSHNIQPSSHNIPPHRQSQYTALIP